MNSASVFAGKSFFTSSTFGAEDVMAIGSNCVGSKLSFLYSTTLVVSGAGCDDIKV